jgi:hypothetical protein
MPKKRPVPAALALAVLSGLVAVAPALAQQRPNPARDARPNLAQPGTQAQEMELKGPAGEAVSHLKDACSELAKAHASIVAGKMKEAQDSLETVRRKLEDTAQVKDAPENIRLMSESLRKRIQGIAATLPGRDLDLAARETGDAVRAMSRDITSLVAIHRSQGHGGGGGPQEERKKQEQEPDKDRMD